MRPTFRTLKVNDARTLQALMAEHAESLEPGLTILDEGALVGEGAIDLVTLDGEGGLVLIAVAFIADDAMLLRVLEAYAWGVEYPDAVARRYPAIRSTPAAPPRVIFVGERFPDAFLRKVKHLRIPSIDCLEFRYLEVNGVAGLFFNAVEDARPGDLPAAVAATPERAVVGPRVPAAVPIISVPAVPVAPVAAPVVTPVVEREIAIPERIPPEPVERVTVERVTVEAPSTNGRAATISPAVQPATATAVAVEPVAPHVTAVVGAADVLTQERARPVGGPPRQGEMPPAELLEGLRMPETLSSQWRRVLSRTPGAPDAAKVLVVREYLQSEFPGCAVYDFYEHQRTAQVFHLQNSQGSLLHTAAVSDEFFEGEAEGDIRRFLDRNRLGRTLRDAGSTDVLVTPGGIRVSKA
jgi:hypothetical protein